MTDDTERARAFYTEVLGWETEVVDVGQGPYTVTTDFGDVQNANGSCC